MKSFSLIVLIILSPLWPFGENPTPGAPFLIVNKQLNEMAYIANGAIQEIFPVATGATAELTPEGMFNILIKAKDPYYRKKNIPGGDAANPLGTRWIGFDARETDGRIYGLHGTNRPDSIGKYVSNGCIRLNNEAIEKLYNVIPVGTKILVVNSDQSFEQLAIEYNSIR